MRQLTRTAPFCFAAIAAVTPACKSYTCLDLANCVSNIGAADAGAGEAGIPATDDDTGAQTTGAATEDTTKEGTTKDDGDPSTAAPDGETTPASPTTTQNASTSEPGEEDPSTKEQEAGDTSAVSDTTGDDEPTGILVVGEACTANTDCSSAHCVDGVCCATACDGECQTCIKPDAEGLCKVDTEESGCGEFTCGGGTRGCNDQCLDDSLACDGECPQGSHACGADCASDTEVASCGEQCEPCPEPGGSGHATCEQGSCGIECEDDFHLCGDTCLSNFDANSCGGSCQPCVVPAGGSVDCDGEQCQPSCPSETRLCDDECVDEATACSNTCPAGRHNCDGVCFNNQVTAGCEALSLSGISDFGTTDGQVLRSYTLFNNSPEDLSLSLGLSSLTAQGCSSSPANLWAIASTTCGAELNAESSCSVTVRFDASVQGADDSCFNVELVGSTNGASTRLTLTGEAGTGHTWQIKLNSNTFTYDNSAPAVGTPCTSVGTVRDARQTEVSYVRRFVYRYTTTPPSQGSCASGKYAVQSCDYYQGDSCGEVELMPGACGITCADTNVADAGCQTIYRQLICQ